MFGPTSLKGMATARSLLERTIRVQSLQPIRVHLCHPLPNKSCRHLHLRLSTSRLRRRYIPTMTRSIIRPTDQACTSTHRGSDSGSGTARVSSMALGSGTVTVSRLGVLDLNVTNFTGNVNYQAGSIERWSADGARIFFAAGPATGSIFEKAFSGAGPEKEWLTEPGIVHSPGHAHPGKLDRGVPSAAPTLVFGPAHARRRNALDGNGLEREDPLGRRAIGRGI